MSPRNLNLLSLCIWEAKSFLYFFNFFLFIFSLLLGVCFAPLLLTAMSVAAENASGTVVETKRDGATAIAIAVKLTLFLPHHLCSPKIMFLLFYSSTTYASKASAVPLTTELTKYTQALLQGKTLTFGIGVVEEFQERLVSCSLKNS